MIGWELPPNNSGGLGVACQGLAEALAGKDTEVLFVLPRKLNVDNGTFKVLFANVRSVYQGGKPLSVYLTSGPFAKKICRDEACYGLMDEVNRFAYQIRRIAMDERFDLIHAHDWLSFPAGIEAKKISGKPLICQIHSTEVDRTGGNYFNKDIYDIELEGLKEADKVVAVSGITKSVIKNNYGIASDKIKVVHNGINHSEFVNDLDSLNLIKLKKMGYKIVLFVGRVTLQKGPEYLVRAASKVLKYDPNVYFVFVGSGDMEGQVLEEAIRLGISDKVIMTGFLRNERRNRLYRSADLFVMPSVSDPFGLVALESLMLKTPVLISNQSGVTEVVPNSLKVDFWDTDEMANKIVAVLTWSSLKNTLTENGYRDALRLDWGKAADKCVDIYRSLV
jgi:glycosyltransferase involved in cell wall biosynthesis